MAKRKLPPHIVLPDGRWRFVKKGYKSQRQSNPSIRRKPIMAKRGRRVTRYVTRKAKGGYRKRKGLLSGNTGNIIIGAAAGFASPYIPRILGGWTLPVVYGVAGYAFKKPALLSIAGYEIGKTLSTGGLLGGLGGGNGGGASQI